MQLEIICPSCGKESKTAYTRIPKGKLKVTCHSCKNQFDLNKETQLNCRRVRKTEGKEYADNGWKVEHPACQGMEYDLEAVQGLIRSGMVGADTRLCPPSERAFFPASTFGQLKKALEQWEAKNRGKV